MPKVHRAVVAFSVIFVLLAALLALAYLVPAPAVVSAADGLRHTLRLYGRWSYGAGAREGNTIPSPVDPEITSRSAYPEDPPYTVPDPIFNPQLEQAPIKDSITWNPLFMSEFETLDENHALGLYQKIFAGTLNATEKVWFRMWYEPTHWDKDLNANGELDIDGDTEMPYPPGERDEWYPAVMQEFTYMLMEADLLANEPEPLAGQVGRTSFVFPVGMRKADLFTSGGAVDETSPNARYGYGLTSLDGDFDGVPDIVYVESELTLFAETRVAADFDGDGAIEPLDLDNVQLNGNELAVFRLETKPLAVSEAVQFLDHLVVVKAVFEDSALLDVWYTGDMVPVYLGSRTIFVGDMLLSGNSGPGQRIPAGGTNVCDFPTGPWFVFLDSIDIGDDQARLMVGRALGATWSAMEDAPNQLDLRPGDPWFLKRFYVDGHEYNVVALKTRNGTDNVVFDPAGCTLSPGDWPPEVDPTEFKFITIRTPVPKEGTYADPLAGYLIEQHSVRLQPYPAETELSVMPPYNHEHYIILDVQAIEAFTCEEEDVDYFGPLAGPVPPILQQNGPFPYQGVGPYSPYTDRREMSLLYSAEDKNPQFLGELKEKYGQNAAGEQYWYVEQFRTVPYHYTEFALPDLNPAHIGGHTDLYLLTSAFVAPQSEYILWRQGLITNTFNLTWDEDLECWVREYPSGDMPDDWEPRVKFWFDPGEGGKKYKDDEGIRVYGFDSEGPGAEVTDGANDAYPVEVWPYTDPMAPFNPQLPEAPPKDSLTFNPAYMNEFIHSNESLVSLYRQISIREQNAYEKVFLRMWYEPEYLDKIRIEGSDEYVFPALMQEFTYMYLDTQDQPASAQPKSSAFAFPMATAAGQLPAPDPVTHALPASQLPSFGWGLTSFDANFDGQHDIVHLHSENSLSTLTGISADFDGDGGLDLLDEDTTPLNGNEMVVFALEDMVLRRGDSVQFLDHMVTLDNVSSDRADLQIWYTGGGLHNMSGGYSLHPDRIGSYSMRTREMAIAKRSAVRVLPAGGGNLNSTDGAWFVFVNAINPGNETVSLLVGRALGAAHSAIDDGNGGHDLANGDPWYLKRFFVDGHEYNVVAVHVVPATVVNPGDERYEFKYITIRTPVPKENFINYEDSQKLEGYYRGTVWGVDTSVISLMPPFNFPHTGMEDIQALPERDPVSGDIVFGNPDLFDEDCHGDVIKDLPPYQIRIVDEDQEPQFFGELKEKYWEAVDAAGVRDELWQTEQWHIVPDEYTELQLPQGQKYLLTSAWQSDQMEVNFYRCLGEPNGGGSGVSLQQDGRDRVKFWYDPDDPQDLYINTWQGPGPGPTPTPSPTPPPGATGTIRGRVLLQGRSDYSGAVVSTAGVSGVTDANGYFTLSNVPAGTHDVKAEMAGYLDHVKTGVVLAADELKLLSDVRLLGGDADNNCLVNVFDLVIVAWNYDSSPPTDLRADINGNNRVDIFDLVMVGANLDQACPGPWAAPSTVAPQALAPAHLRVWPADPLMAPLGGLVKVTLEIEDVQNLYGADVDLSFDPDLLEVVDVDPVTPGVQIERGDFPDPAQGAVAAEEADNVTGMVSYAITLKSPVSPASGSGTLCAITFRAKAVGTSALTIQSAELLDEQAVEIEVLTHGGEIQVGEDYALIYLPIVFKPGNR
jgi:hypothetical protein